MYPTRRMSGNDRWTLRMTEPVNDQVADPLSDSVIGLSSDFET